MPLDPQIQTVLQAVKAAGLPADVFPELKEAE